MFPCSVTPYMRSESISIITLYIVEIPEPRISLMLKFCLDFLVHNPVMQYTLYISLM